MADICQCRAHTAKDTCYNLEEYACLICHDDICRQCSFTVKIFPTSQLADDSDLFREVGNGWVICGECNAQHVVIKHGEPTIPAF